jgi:hypothetical protein
VRRKLLAGGIGALLLCTCGIVLVRTAHDDEHAHGRRPQVASVTTGPAHVTRLPTAVTRTAWPSLPSDAVPIATRYAIAAFSTTTDVASDAWITAIASICTPAWRVHLEAATNGGEMARTTDRPQVVRVFSSWGPHGELGATVLLLNKQTGNYEATYLDLKRVGHRYLVAAAQ